MDKIDFLSPKTTFYFNSNSSYSSCFGGFLTFCTGLVSIGLFLLFGSDLFFREEPEVSTSIAVNENPALNQSQLFPAIALMYIGGFQIKEINRKLEFNLITLRTDSSTEEVTSIGKYSLLPCDESVVFIKKNTKEALIADSKMYFCPPDDLKYSIEAPFGSTKFNVIKLEVNYCTGRADCYSSEFIRKNLTDIYVHAVFDDYYVDAFDFKSPVKENVSKILNSISSGFTQNFHMNLRELDFKNQEGWVFSQNSFTTHYRFDSKDFSISDLNEKKTIVDVMFAFDNFKQVYNRSYIKVQDVLAQVAGAIKITNIIFRLLALAYSYFRVNNERMITFGKNKEKSETSNSSHNNFVPSHPNFEVKLTKNTLKHTASICNLLFRRAKIDEFSKFYKKVLSEQNIFELCALHEIQKKNLARRAEIENQTKLFVQERGLGAKGNNGN